MGKNASPRTNRKPAAWGSRMAMQGENRKSGFWGFQESLDKL
jgi:hypothetical protein